MLGLVGLALCQLLLVASAVRSSPVSASAQVVNEAGHHPLRYPTDELSVDHEAPSMPPPADIITEHQAFLPLVVRQSTMTEARALWVTRWDYTTITDVQTLVERAAGARFNMLLFQVRGTADAFYTPGPEPWAAQLSEGALGEDPGWDPLAVAIEAAHARGMELHAWLNVYPVWSGETAPPNQTDPEHLFWTLSYKYSWSAWRSTDISGTPMLLDGSGYVWATPALTDVVDRVVSVADEVVGRYDVDGIHLDVVRYPGPDTSYDPFSNASFEAAQAKEATLTRSEWQRRQVTGLVRRVYGEAVLSRADVRLSAAVWPIYQDHWDWGYREGYSDFYQDSQGWIADDAIDTIMPMLYTGVFLSDPQALTPLQFRLATSDFLAHDGGRHVFPGISAEHLDFADIAERIATARELGAPGQAIFSARLLDRKGYWDDLAAGPYATEAVIPPMAWRP